VIQLVEMLNALGRRLAAHLWQMTIASVAALVVTGCLGLPTAAKQKAEDAKAKREESKPRKERTMAATGLQYGFRYDPMQFVEKDRTLQGALVRTFVFEKPKRDDKKVIEAAIQKELAAQKKRGEPDALALLRLGATPDRPDVKRAVETMCQKKLKEDGTLGVYALRAACLTGWKDREELSRSLRKLAAQVNTMNFLHFCPWTPAVHLKALGAGAELVDTSKAIARGLGFYCKHMNEAGALDFLDPWAFLDVAGQVDHPLTRTVVKKQLMMILRTQRSDGGWGDKSVVVFRALKKHDLLEGLRKHPPLPADFKIVRSIPAPRGDLFTMTSDGRRLWVYDRKANEAIAISPKDRSVRRRLKLPVANARGIGWWGRGLGVTQQNPKQESWKANPKARMLHQVDPQTGKVVQSIPLHHGHNIWGVTQVFGKLVVGDGFLNAVNVIDPPRPADARVQALGGPGPIGLTAQGRGVWHFDWLFPTLVYKSDLRGRLLDWGTLPFEPGDGDWRERLAVRGLAWDGQQLWALDASSGRICAIERSGAAPKAKRGAADATTAPEATVAKSKYPEVLLEGAVTAFSHITTHVASHQDWDEDVYPYPQPCVYLVAHLVEIWAAGWNDVDFDTLAAVSGASALFAYEPNTFMPKYANLLIGMDKRIAEATGFGYEWVSFKGADGAWTIIKETIDSGRPLKGWHAENVVFAAYQDATKKSDRKVFAMTDGPEYYAKWWTWGEFTKWVETMKKRNQCQLGRHTKRVRPLAAKKIALRVMKDLVEWSVQPPEACRRRFPKATFGLAGMEAYAADCGNLRQFKSWGMCHGINPQWTVRHSTAVYLRRLAEAKTFPRKVTEHITAAAREYKAAFTAWHKTYGLLGHGATKEERRAKSRREEGARLVRQAIEHERAAIEELKKALTTLNH